METIQKTTKWYQDKDNFWIQILKEPNEDVVAIKPLKQRYLFIPFMVIVWFTQLIIYSVCMGTFCVIFGILGLFVTLSDKPKDRDWGSVIWMIFIPFAGPFIWWVRYIKFGEYGSFIRD